MSAESRFLGRPFSYWWELQRRFDQQCAHPVEAADLLQEIATLRGLVSYYESRVREMTGARKLVDIAPR